ncbi:MAG: HlyD family efflux transporter periplasmic adaptor subunit, partial [Patescibacteria group bacterium]
MTQEEFLRQNGNKPTGSNKGKKNTYKAIIFLAILLLGGFFYAGAEYFGIVDLYQSPVENGAPEEDNIDNDQNIPQVEVSEVSADKQATEAVSVMGKMIADVETGVTSLVSGTVQKVNFKEGDPVSKGDVLIELSNEDIQLEYENTLMEKENRAKDLNETKESARLAIEEAESGVGEAEQSMESARSGVESAQVELDNTETELANTKETQEKKISDAKQSAVLSFGRHIGFIKKVLDDVNYILNVDQGPRLEGLKPYLLSAKSSQVLRETENLYEDLKKEKNELEEAEVDEKNIEKRLEELIDVLQASEELADKMMEVLEKTITDDSFTEQMLNEQKSAFNSLHSQVVETKGTVDSRLNELENVQTEKENRLDSLEGSVRSAQKRVEDAENKLASSRLSYENAKVSLRSNKQQQRQQIVSAENQIDTIEGNLRKIQKQLRDLTIEAPISGQVKEKEVEEGDRVGPEQTLARLTGADQIKAEAYLSPLDAMYVNIGDEVVINGDIAGKITAINPTVDSEVRKVKIKMDISEEEMGDSLIPGTTVEIDIPLTGKEKEQAVFLVPLKAVMIDQQESFVFV